MANKDLKIVGHRGARGLAPENTLASIQKALECRVDEIEIDVFVTKDGIPVLDHNGLVRDPAGNLLLIRHHTLEELRAHKPDLATLSEIITAINKAVPLTIEVKPGIPAEPVVRVIEEYLRQGWRVDHFRLASFDFGLLQELHHDLPDVQIVVNETCSGVRATWRARRLGAKRLCMDRHWLWYGFIRAMQRGGWELYAYTLNDPAKARRWARWGLAGVVTDLPDRFQK